MKLKEITVDEFNRICGTSNIYFSNGGKKKNGDNCFTFNISFGYLYFNYINWNLQGSK